MSVTELPDEVAADQADERPGGPVAGGAPPGDEWLTDKRGRPYVRARGRQGTVYRVGDETIAEALERDAKPRDQRPRKSKTAKKPPPPTKADLKELELVLAEALRSPAMICATFGDGWAADHFTNQGPVLARNLVVASEHNPWLRRKLETAASGGDMMMQLITMVGIAGALIGYAIPPVIYWFNLPVPDQARSMFGIPERREDDGVSAPPQAFPAAA